MIIAFPYSIFKHGFLIKDIVLLIKYYCQHFYGKLKGSCTTVLNQKIAKWKKDKMKGNKSNILQTMDDRG